MSLTTITIKLPLYRPTLVKQDMYKTMRSHFSQASNQALLYLQEVPVRKATELDRLLRSIPLPSTLLQEARKLAVSRYQDWRKHANTKGFPSFRANISILFDNQNWRLRFDQGHLKIGIPTIEGHLTIDKYVPASVNDYALFWVNYLLTGERRGRMSNFSTKHKNTPKLACFCIYRVTGDTTRSTCIRG
ncbi:hypothetical protein [Paenibacillus sp. GCM10027626]|uniref:hypothetical protein n=1 Tax=Paenibacillus sp. GCM10027626 TaxID=3273411 RepID=UPI003632DCEC